MVSSNGEQYPGEQLLEEHKRRHRTKETVDVEEEKVKIVIFTCGGNRYAFYGRDVREILASCDISWVPSLPGYVLGLINVRGDIESVIDICHFLGKEKNTDGNSLVAMLVRGDFCSGVMVDAIEDVVDIPLSSIQPPLGTLNGAARDLVCGETDIDGESVSLLDIGKLAALISL
jgi:purine-binding chemotaxis protein CheW